MLALEARAPDSSAERWSSSRLQRAFRGGWAAGRGAKAAEKAREEERSAVRRAVRRAVRKAGEERRALGDWGRTCSRRRRWRRDGQDSSRGRRDR